MAIHYHPKNSWIFLEEGSTGYYMWPLSVNDWRTYVLFVRIGTWQRAVEVLRQWYVYRHLGGLSGNNARHEYWLGVRNMSGGRTYFKLVLASVGYV